MVMRCTIMISEIVRTTIYVNECYVEYLSYRSDIDNHWTTYREGKLYYEHNTLGQYQRFIKRKWKDAEIVSFLRIL